MLFEIQHSLYSALISGLEFILFMCQCSHSIPRKYSTCLPLQERDVFYHCHLHLGYFELQRVTQKSHDKHTIQTPQAQSFSFLRRIPFQNYLIQLLSVGTEINNLGSKHHGRWCQVRKSLFFSNKSICLWRLLDILYVPEIDWSQDNMLGTNVTELTTRNVWSLDPCSSMAGSDGLSQKHRSIGEIGGLGNYEQCKGSVDNFALGES